MSDRRGTLNADLLFVRPTLEWFEPLDRTLWAVVIGAAVADTVLTIVGLQLCFVEANPVAAWAIQQLGAFGLVLLKGGALLVLFGAVRQLSHTYSLAALLGFSLPQLYATINNTMLFITHAASCLA